MTVEVLLLSFFMKNFYIRLLKQKFCILNSFSKFIIISLLLSKIKNHKKRKTCVYN